MTIFVFDAHGSIESRNDSFDLPVGVTLVVFGLPGAAIAEEIPDEIYKNRRSLFANPLSLLSSMGITVVGRESKGFARSDSPSVRYPESPVIITGPVAVPNLVLTGDEDLSGSYVYYNVGEQTRRHELNTDQTLTLNEAFAPPTPLFNLVAGDWIIWACCLSVHFEGPITRKSVSGLGNEGPGGTGTGGTAYGFKSILS